MNVRHKVDGVWLAMNFSVQEIRNPVWYSFPKMSSGFFRAYAAVKLNSYIAILDSLKHKNTCYNSKAIGRIFQLLAIVHSYLWLCTVARSLKNNNILLNFSLSSLIKIIFSLFLSFSLSSASLISSLLRRPARQWWCS